MHTKRYKSQGLALKVKLTPLLLLLHSRSLSQLTGVLIISVPGEIYTYGAQYSLIVASLGFAVLVVNHALLPVFFENNIVNCYEVAKLMAE